MAASVEEVPPPLWQLGARSRGTKNTYTSVCWMALTSTHCSFNYSEKGQYIQYILCTEKYGKNKCNAFQFRYRSNFSVSESK